MITYNTVEALRRELGRCTRALQAFDAKLGADPSLKFKDGAGCRESATLKRVSMDLSNALVDLRATPKRMR